MALTDPILTLSFEGKLDDITLQYHPSRLQLSENSQARSVPGLDNVITFVPKQTTTLNAIRISAFFTALTPKQDEIGVPGIVDIDLVAGATATTLVSAASLGGRVVLDILDAATSTISLAKGVYDIGTGLISPAIINPTPVGLADDQFRKLRNLTEALQRSIPCYITWDIALDSFPTNRYIITDMEVSTEDIHEETGASMAINVDLSLAKHGTRIEVV